MSTGAKLGGGIADAPRSAYIGCDRIDQEGGPGMLKKRAREMLAEAMAEVETLSVDEARRLH